MFKFFLKNFYLFYVFITIIIFFLFFDYVLSKNTNLFQIRKNCFEYFKIVSKNKDYYSYDLAENCFAFEKKSTTPSYTVQTNEDRIRIGLKKKETPTEKIIFLGDSFTYGFGVDYENSIPGYISKKVENQYDVINLGVTGYSPTQNLFRLNRFLKKNNTLKIKKLFYILDITDVHDEANRWIKIDGIDRPVLVDDNAEDEIKKTFEDSKFRTSKFVAYSINKYLRNLKKKIKDYFQKDLRSKQGTYWGKYMYTPQENLLKDAKYQSLWPIKKEIGFKKINKNIKLISNLSKNKNAEFYIVIHPWMEILDYGQKEFNWEKYAEKLCHEADCKKLISFFDDARSVKKNFKDWKTLLYFRSDQHHTGYANKLYSDRIFKEAFN